MINTKKRGDRGVASAINRFDSLEYTVCIPLSDSQEYDLIVEKDAKLFRVQVKYTNYKSKYGNYEVGLRVVGRKGEKTYTMKLFDGTQFDLLYILTSEGKEYIIPASDIKATTAIVLSEKYNGYMLE